MPPTRRRRLTPDQRRNELLTAAIELAAGTDISSISVAELAKRAGVSEGLLYHYFPTKQALVVAAVRRAADAFLADVRAVPGATPQERLLAALGAYLDHVQAEPDGWRALLQARAGDLADIGDELEAASIALVIDALGIDEPSPLLRATLGGWAELERRLCLDWLVDADIERGAVEDALASTFFAALDSVARHDPATAGGLERLGAAG